MEQLKVVINSLKDANLKIKPEKCNWFAKEIKVLGPVVSEREIEMDLDKIQAINEMIFPRNVKQVQQFLGFCGYYRRFVKDFAKVAAPLYALLKKEVIREFNEACEQAFNELKLRLVKYPILRQPNFNFPFWVYTDASGFAVGLILAQTDEENYKSAFMHHVCWKVPECITASPKKNALS